MVLYDNKRKASRRREERKVGDEERIIAPTQKRLWLPCREVGKVVRVSIRLS